MGLLFRRRPVARLAVGDATAGAAYHAGRRRAEHDQYDDKRPRLTAADIPAAALWVGIVILLIGEVIDYLRTQRRRTAHRLADWWAGVEREEHRTARRAEIAALARRINRQRD